MPISAKASRFPVAFANTKAASCSIEEVVSKLRGFTFFIKLAESLQFNKIRFLTNEIQHFIHFLSCWESVFSYSFLRVLSDPLHFKPLTDIVIIF